MYHLLDGSSRSHTQVTRNAFSSELLGLSNTADDTISLAWTLHEFKMGPMKSTECKTMYESGRGLRIAIVLGTDSMSIFTALSSMTVKTPQEKHLEFSCIGSRRSSTKE